MPKKKQAPPPDKIRIKRGDIVKVISGSDKGKTGRVLDVNKDTGKLLVEGIRMIKRHTRPNPAKQVKGGIAERESAIHVSNVAAATSGGVASRIGYRMESTPGGTRRVRIAKKTGEVLDKKA